MELTDALEALIDHHGLYAVAEALAEVSHAKADHLANNWQDHGAAKRWTKAAVVFDRAENSLRKIQLHASRLNPQT
jgi:hypothetical protein